VNKLRWGKFYWSDWADDPALALCSLAAQGLWVRLLCIAAQGTPYGHVTINGKPATVEQLEVLIRFDGRGHGANYLAKLIAELERNGVAVRAPCGCLISRRMERDGKLYQARRNAAQKRWKSAQEPSKNHQRNSERNSAKAAGEAGNGSDLHMQKTSFASTESSEAEAEAESPRSPPLAGGARTRRRPSRNGFVDIALDMIEEQRHAEADDARPSGARVVDLTRHLGGRKPPA
jgi:hypothetical protein